MNNGSPRTLVVPCEPGDFTAITRLFTDAAVREFLGGALDETQARARAMEILETSDGVWAIRSAETPDSLAGLLWLAPHHQTTDTEVSYVLLPEATGRGHATDAVRRALRHAFGNLGLKRVVAETQTRNLRSVRLLERVGMTLESNLVRFGEDQSVYAISAEHWKRG